MVYIKDIRCLKVKRTKTDKLSREELEDRLNYELNAIKSMGYIEYFLIVWDFIHFANPAELP